MAKKCFNKSAGMLICDDGGKFLLIERTKWPYGWAPPAGHMDKKHESARNTAIRETREEVGLRVSRCRKLLDKIFDKICNRGGKWHRYRVFRAVNWRGKPKISRSEAKRFVWVSRSELGALAERTEAYLKGKIPEKKWEKKPGLEAVWYEIFKLLRII